MSDEWTNPDGFARVYRKVITQTRYSGAYEGGQWVAFVSDWDLPDQASGGDTECRAWWQDRSGAEHTRTVRIGRGSSAVDALADLQRRWLAAGSPPGFDWHRSEGGLAETPYKPG